MNNKSIEASSLELAAAHITEAVRLMETNGLDEKARTAADERAFGHARKARQLVGGVVRTLATQLKVEDDEEQQS